MVALANRILAAFALALDLPENWFEAKTTEHQSALRALYPPPSCVPNVD